MRVESLDIRGFKRLVGQFDFSPELTVVYGDNEAGKSSMHEALIHTLCGFSRSERRHYEGESYLDTCRPWNGNAFAINAAVEARGERFRLEWDFDEHRVHVVNTNSGEDLSAEMVGQRGDVNLGQFLVGLSLEDFCQACCLDQAEISAVTASESLVAALQRAVESGATATGVERAVDRLNDTLRSEIGVRVDTLNPNRDGHLYKLADRAEKLEQQLDRANQMREELAQLEQARHEQLVKLTALGRTLRAVEQAILRRDAQDLAQREQRAEAHQSRSIVEEPQVRLPTESEQQAITSPLGELDRITNQLPGVEAQAEAAREAVAGLEAQRRQVQLDRDALEAYASFDASREREVTDLLARRAELRQTQARPVETAPAAPAGGGSQRALWAAAAAAAVLSIALGLAVSPVLLAGLIVAAALAYLARRSSPAVIALQVGPADLAQRLNEMEVRLAQSLDGAQAASAPDLEQRANTYLDACQRHNRWRQLSGDLSDLRTQLQAARQPVDELERVKRRVDEIDVELAEHLGQLGIAATDLAAARAEFSNRMRQAQEFRDKQVAAAEAEEGYRTALGEFTPDDLAAEAEHVAAALEAHVARHGQLEAPPASGVELETQRDELEGTHRETELLVERLATQVRERERELPDIPSCAEELTATKVEIAELQQAAQAIKLAREALQDAARRAHRAFRPHLRARLDKSLARLTAGRYQSVEIDDDLHISVIAPETGQMLPVEQLSRGTQDQIFFVERLEIANLLDPTTDSAPLLLDEPFVHVGPRRLPMALELLVEEAQERQVILFTTDQAVAEQAASTGDNTRSISLTAPEPSSG